VNLGAALSDGLPHGHCFFRQNRRNHLERRGFQRFRGFFRGTEPTEPSGATEGGAVAVADGPATRAFPALPGTVGAGAGLCGLVPAGFRDLEQHPAGVVLATVGMVEAFHQFPVVVVPVDGGLPVDVPEQEIHVGLERVGLLSQGHGLGFLAHQFAHGLL
jgi:hypothetical protein